jgi:excisionase family DNA binding protein
MSEAGMVVGSRRDELVKLRNADLTYAEIGSRLGISRERVRQILKGKPTQKPALDSRLMLTAGDVAQLLGLHINTVRRWSNKGILKSYRINPRGDRRFRREDVDDFLSPRYRF